MKSDATPIRDLLHLGLQDLGRSWRSTLATVVAGTLGVGLVCICLMVRASVDDMRAHFLEQNPDLTVLHVTRSPSGVLGATAPTRLIGLLHGRWPGLRTYPTTSIRAQLVSGGSEGQPRYALLGGLRADDPRWQRPPYDRVTAPAGDGAAALLLFEPGARSHRAADGRLPTRWAVQLPSMGGGPPATRIGLALIGTIPRPARDAAYDALIPIDLLGALDAHARAGSGTPLGTGGPTPQVDPRWLQQAAGVQHTYDRIDLYAPARDAVAPIKAMLQARHYAVEAPLDAFEELEAIDRAVDFALVFLLAFALVAGVAATGMTLYSIHLRRRQELLLMRIVGIPRPYLALSTIVQGLLIGLVSSGLGVLLSLALTRGLSTLPEIGGRPLLTPEPFPLLAAVVVGVLIPVLSSLPSAGHAVRVNPARHLDEVV